MLTTTIVQSVDWSFIPSAALSTKNNTQCYYWRDPCQRDGNWVNKCTLTPRIERISCQVKECNVGKCEDKDALIGPEDTTAKIPVTRAPRRLKVAIREEPAELDPVKQSGCYFWYDPCPETSKTCAPPPRVLHTACDDVRCNLGPCREPDTSLEEEEEEEELLKVDLHDFNGDGLTDREDIELKEEIEKDILSKRKAPVVIKKEEEKESLHSAARERMRDGCFDEAGGWTQDPEGCAEDQKKFLLQAMAVDEMVSAEIAEDDSQWQEKITETLFEPATNERQLELQQIMSKGIYRFAILQEREGLSETLQKNLRDTMQDMSSLYEILLNKEDITEEQLDEISMQVKKHYSYMETLMDDEERNLRIEREQIAMQTTEEEESLVEDIAALEERHEDVFVEEEHSEPGPYPREYRGPRQGDIYHIVEKTEKLLSKIPVVVELYEEEGIEISPAAMQAYEEAQELFNRVKPACEENIETCFRLWDVYIIIERMQGPMVAALYSSGNAEVIQQIEEIFREVEGDGPYMPPPQINCDHIAIGNEETEMSMGEWCEEYMEEEMYGPYGVMPPYGSMSSDMYYPDEWGNYYPPYESNMSEGYMPTYPDGPMPYPPGPGSGDGQWFWTMDGRSYFILNLEECARVGTELGWSEQEKEWCTYLFRNPDEWGPMPGGSHERTYWDSQGGEHHIETRKDCDRLGTELSLPERDVRDCNMMFDNHSGPYEGTHNPFFWDSQGNRYEVESTEDCERLANEHDWSDEEKMWCNGIFMPPVPYGPASPTFWDSQGGNFRVGEREDCNRLADENSWSANDTEDCTSMYDYWLENGGAEPYSGSSGRTYRDSEGREHQIGSWRDCDRLVSEFEWDRANKLACEAIASDIPQYGPSSDRYFWDSNNTEHLVESQESCARLSVEHGWSDMDLEWCLRMFEDPGDGGGGGGGGNWSHSFWSPSKQQSFIVRIRADCESLVSNGDIPRIEKEMCYMALEPGSGGGGGGNWSYTYWSPSKQQSFSVGQRSDCDDLVSRGDIPSSETTACYAAANSTGGGGRWFTTYWSPSKNRSFEIEKMLDCDDLVSRGDIPESERNMCYSVMGGGNTGSSGGWGTGSSSGGGSPDGSSYYWSLYADESFPISSESDCDALVSSGDIPSTEKDWCYMALPGRWDNIDWNSCGGNKCFWSPSSNQLFNTQSESDCDTLVSNGDIPEAEKEFCYMEVRGNWGGDYFYWSPSASMSFPVRTNSDCDALVSAGSIPSSEKQMCYDLISGNGGGSSSGGGGGGSSSGGGGGNTTSTGREYWSTNGERFHLETMEDCEQLAIDNNWSDDDKRWCKQMFNEMGSSSGFEYWTDTGEHYWVESKDDCSRLAGEHSWNEQNKNWCESMFTNGPPEGGSGGGNTGTSSGGGGGGGYNNSSYWSMSANKSFPIVTESDCTALVSRGDIPSSELEWCKMAVPGNWDNSNMNSCGSDNCYWSMSANTSFPVSSESDCDALVSNSSIPSSELEWCKMALPGAWSNSNTRSCNTTYCFWSHNKMQSYSVENESDCENLASSGTIPSHEVDWCKMLFGGGSDKYKYGSPTANKSFYVPTTSACDDLIAAGTILESEKDSCHHAATKD